MIGNMVVQVQKIGDEFVLPPQVAQELGLVDGSRVEVRKAATEPAQIEYLTDDEARSLFEKIEPLHRNTFQELAK
jgi:antitoxin component of MazEF toxin-antitoxin module